MAEILKGAPVAAAVRERAAQDVAVLAEKGITPTLAILRVGENDSDIAYENGASKQCDKVGVAVRKVILPETVEYDEFYRVLNELNEDDGVHGILMLRPLPKHLDNEKARQMLNPAKDVDGCTDGSLAGVFTNTKNGFAPCTAQSCMEILHYYNIDPSGKKVAIIGRSLVIGRPVAMLMMHENATPTICHTRTQDVAAITRDADIIIAASGQMESIGADYVRPGQIILDVGVNWNEAKGKLCGDVIFEEVEPIVAAITPVPGGVGTGTSSVLASHVVEAAMRLHA